MGHDIANSSAERQIETLFQAGRSAWFANDLDHAITHLTAAHARAPENPQVAFALGISLLKAGRFEDGYALYSQQRAGDTRAAPPLPIPRWAGEPPAGKHFLIWGQDGYGHQIMWVRLAKDLLAQGGRVTWLGPPALARLFEGLGMTYAGDQSVTISGVDHYVPSRALFSGFGATRSVIRDDPYLQARPRPGSGRIGVMTQADAQHADGPARTLDGAAARALLDLPGAINLAPEATGARDFQDTAEIIAGLDLVISVDTAVAHLAGALGARVIILLPHVADWRWLTDPGRSIWYRNATLVRQSADGGWGPAVKTAMRLAQSDVAGAGVFQADGAMRPAARG